MASLFEDNLTLDNLSRPQLVSMCRYMNINAFGTDNFLRHTIRTRMDKLRQDDRVIDREGLDALSDAELTAACQSRGIQTQAKSPDDLRTELAQWIELHMKRGIAGTLLVLGKAFSFGSSLPTEAGETNQIASLRDVLSSLPDNLVSATELEVSEDAATPQQRLEVLEQQEGAHESSATLTSQTLSKTSRSRKTRLDATTRRLDERRKRIARPSEQRQRVNGRRKASHRASRRRSPLEMRTRRRRAKRAQTTRATSPPSSSRSSAALYRSCPTSRAC